MADGRVIFKGISTSRRFNRLYHFGEGLLAQLIYMISYPHADNWGHLPFDESTIKLRAMPGYPGDLGTLLYAMCLLVHVRLWEPPYSVNEEFYIHIFNFESKSRDGIRKRLRGEWPDESGVIPKRERKSGKMVSIEDCIAKAAKRRIESTLYIDPYSHPKFSGIFRKIREYSVNSQIDLELSADKYGSTPEKLYHLFYNISINKQQIPPRFLIKLFNSLNRDLEMLGRVLYRARNADSVIAYVQAGVSAGWILSHTTEEEVAPADVRDWIDKLFGLVGPGSSKPGIAPIDTLVEGLFE